MLVRYSCVTGTLRCVKVPGQNCLSGVVPLIKQGNDEPVSGLFVERRVV
jgi:hypothetical protein